MRREADRRRRDRRPDRVTAAARCARFTAARLNVAPPTFVARPMAEHELTAHEYLERAREMLWESIQTLEEAQRVMFRAGDRYVADVWGDGVRAVIELTEKITDVSGDLTKVHIEIGRLGKRDRGRPATE
jgi:hypothetical protein